MKRKPTNAVTQRSLRKLLKWCNSQKLTVEFSAKAPSEFDFKSKKITINDSQRSPEIIIIDLLHECGHHLARKNPNPKRQISDRGYYKIWDINKTKSKPKIDRTHVVIEEIDAWERGLDLAQQLSIKLNMKKFNLVRSKALQSYFVWATQ